MKIIIVANRKNAKTLDAMFQIVAYLESQGINHFELDVTNLPDSSFVGPHAAELARSLYGDDCELIIAIGGDGTLLHTARIANVLEAPILGINFGHLGFLTNSAEDGLIALVADALAGEILRENRMSLHIKVTCKGDEEEPDVWDEDANWPAPAGIAAPAGTSAPAGIAAPDNASTPAGIATPDNAIVPTMQREFFAFNEIAIARGALGHIVDYEFYVSGDKIARMRGDGLIVSTATGSTAYSLSAGGPLVGPSHRGMIAVPLAPHTLNSRAIVTEHHDVVEVVLEEDSASSREVSLFTDGDALALNRPVISVAVTVSDHPITLLTHRNESFYKQVARTFFK